jgi:hypothetical protein
VEFFVAIGKGEKVEIVLWSLVGLIVGTGVIGAYGRGYGSMTQMGCKPWSFVLFWKKYGWVVGLCSPGVAS